MSYSRETIFVLYALFIVAFFVQCYLSYLQNKALQTAVLEMNRTYGQSCYVSVGKKRARLFRKGYVVIVAVDEGKRIVHAKVLSGMTVFARLKTEREIEGQTIDHWMELEKKSMTYKDHAMVDAIEKLVVI